MPSRHAYIGDVSATAFGRKIGDIVYAANSPGAGYLAASAAQEVLTASYPALFNTPFFGVSDAFALQDSLGSATHSQAVIEPGGTFFMMQANQRKSTAAGSYTSGGPTAASGWSINWFNTPTTQNGLLWITGRNSGNTAWGMWTATSITATLVAGNVITFYSGLGDASVADIFWTGTSWLFGVNQGGGVYRCTVSTPLPGSTYTRTYSTGDMAYFLKIGTTIYARDLSGGWIKSADDGVTWSVKTTPTNGPVVPLFSYSMGYLPRTYNASLGACFGMNSSHQVVYNNTDLTAAWTIDPNYPVDATNRPNAKTYFYVDAQGFVWAIAGKSIALRHPSGMWTVLDVGVGSGSSTTDALDFPPTFFDGRLHFKFQGNSAAGIRMLKQTSEAGVFPAITSPFNGYTPYFKVA